MLSMLRAASRAFLRMPFCSQSAGNERMSCNLIRLLPSSRLCNVHDIVYNPYPNHPPTLFSRHTHRPPRFTAQPTYERSNIVYAVQSMFDGQHYCTHNAQQRSKIHDVRTAQRSADITSCYHRARRERHDVNSPTPSRDDEVTMCWHTPAAECVRRYEK